MKQTIGNVGVLNLLNATEESIKSYEKIGNVGVVLYKTGHSHLLAALNIGNIGKTVEVPEGFSYYQGVLNIDEAYINSIKNPLKMVISGTIIINQNVQADQLDTEKINFIVDGEVYSPPHLTGIASQLFSEGSHEVKAYEGAPPRFENGSLILSNSFLQAAEQPMHLVVNGKLALPKELDAELFTEKIKKIEVNGLITVHEEQEVLLHKKMDSSPNGVMQVIPAGYRVLNKILRLNSRSIRSFQEEKIQTNKPIVFEADISREAAEKAISRIDSKSFIVCSEEIEDLIYEKLDRLETAVLPYANRFVLIEGEEEWSNGQLGSFDGTITVIVKGLLHLNNDITEETLKEKLADIDLFGEIRVAQPKIKGALQNKIRTNEGRISESGTKEERKYAGSQNIGELSL